MFYRTGSLEADTNSSYIFTHWIITLRLCTNFVVTVLCEREIIDDLLFLIFLATGRNKNRNEIIAI